MKLRALKTIFAVACMALVMTGCDDDKDDKKLSEISFPTSNQTTQLVAAGSPVVIKVARTNAEESIRVRVSTLKNDSGIFTLPTDIDFPAGTAEVTVNIPFAATTIGTEYTFEIGIVESTQYSYTGPGGGALPKLAVTASIAPKATMQFELSEDMGEYVYPGQEIEFVLTRSDASTSVVVPIDPEINDQDAFVIPSSVIFASGESTKSFIIKVNEAVELGREYGLKFRFYDGLNLYVDANGETISVTKSATAVEMVPLGLKFESLAIVEPGTSTRITFTPSILHLGTEFAIQVLENEDDVFELPANVTIRSSSIAVNVGLKDTAELDKDYKLKITVPATSTHIFIDPETGKAPALEITIRSQEIIVADFASIAMASTSAIAKNYVVPGVVLTQKVTLAKAREQAITIPIIVVEGDTGMFTADESVTIPAGQTTAVFDVVLSSAAVRGTTYTLKLKAADGILPSNAHTGDMTPPVLNISIEVSTGSYEFIGMYRVTESEVATMAKTPMPYRVPLLRDSDTGNYVVPNMYKATGSFSFTWDGGTTVTAIGAAQTYDGKSTMGWGAWTVYGNYTSLEPGDTFYDPATKTFTIYSMLVNLGTNPAATMGWHTDKFTLIE